MITKKNNGFSVKHLNRSLLVFFKNALRVAIKNPGQAWAFVRTLRWLRQAAKRRNRWKAQDVPVPPIIIFSITNECNLECKGCYAKALHTSGENKLNDEELERIVGEASELGVSFFVVAGGEPFMRQVLLDITEKYPEMIFLVFTNGLLIDDRILGRMAAQKNVIPLVSLEGYEKDTDGRRGEGTYALVLVLMEKMRQRKMFFGVSLTITEPTFEMLTNKSYVEHLIDIGCKFFLYLEYTPILLETENLVITPEQREELMRRMVYYRKGFPALFIAVPGDEAAEGGCLSSGRGFVHINAEGNLEPCPYAPFSDVNLKNSSLKDALQSKLLKELRKHPEELRVDQGGCVLWKKRKWVQSLLDSETH
ncbi:MAG: radical SAM protein [Candidatus Aminicenantes bacterium]|jgi:MoaA/NifB/PqqE/SkfB family radical SAM enzyme